jgi:hypothetical protein
MAILGYNKSIQFVRAFGLAEWLQTRGLAGWLEIATDGLEAPARQRIANEIGAHYTEAVGVHMAAGESELSAERLAMADLGDPQEAAVNFRRNHLTESEAKSMRWMERTAAKPLFSLRMLPLDGIPAVWLALLFTHAHRYYSPLLDPQFLAGLALVAYAGCRLIPRWLYARNATGNSFLGELAFSCFVTNAALLFTLALIPCLQNNDGVSGFLFLIYTYQLNPGFRIWRKLRNMCDKRNDLPPWQSTAS